MNNWNLLARTIRKITWIYRGLRSDRNIRVIARVVNRQPLKEEPARPVIFFNASTRIRMNSFNAAYSLISSWILRRAGIPVVHFLCREGMTRCVLGTNPEHPERRPPCRSCLKRSRILHSSARVYWFSYQPDYGLENLLGGLNINQLVEFNYQEVPLGELVLPALRWRFRVHHLKDNEKTRLVCREYILSAWNIYNKFEKILSLMNPQAVIAFNGQFFPEATVCWAAKRRGIRTITHEVGLQPYSAFFTQGEATAYPIHIPEKFELTSQQNARLDAYIERRSQGRFSMAGIHFWPKMTGLDDSFFEKARAFKHIVPVFTNVIFDTSQPHANVIFPEMFSWLDAVLLLAHSHLDTLFVIRAHPDETRPSKESRETVSEWIASHKANELSNVIFIAPNEYFSSYELIHRAKFVMIYNSTIGLEASIMGAPVLAAGKSRFTNYPIVFTPATIHEYLELAEKFLAADKVEVPREFTHNARRFLYYQVFRVSLPFDTYLEPALTPGFVLFRPFPLSQLSPERSATVRAFLTGFVSERQFELEDIFN